MKLKMNLRIWYILITVMVLVGCNKNQANASYTISAAMPCEIESGGTKSFSLSGTLPSNAEISWDATEPGTFTNPTAPVTNFIAPTVTQDTPMSITTTVTGRRGQAVQTINCTILAPVIEVAEEPEPVEPAEVEVVTQEPIEELETVIIEEDAEQPMDTCPLLEIFPQVGGCIPFEFYSNAEIQDSLLVTEFVNDPVCVHSGEFGLKLINNTGGTGEYAGWGAGWGMTGFDASEYTKLSFWVIGLAGGERFEFGLKDTYQIEHKVQSVIVAPSMPQNTWKHIEINLSEFADVNMTSLENFHFAFNDVLDHGSGTICVDDIAFVE